MDSSFGNATVDVLANGLEIIVLEDHSAPVVSAQAWCRAGSIHEGDWLGAGLSHVLEHMLFKGTKSREGHRIDQEVQEVGGYMNAYTSFDRTVYWIDAPDNGLKTILGVLCDIMQNASLPPETLAKELDVIRREMDMGHDDPSRRSGKRLFETAYTKSPYRYPIIGHLDIFNRLTPEDIRRYYEQKYIPNNLFFVVAGKVERSAVLDQIGEAFADCHPRPCPSPVLPREPRQSGPRRLIEEDDVELGHAHIVWHIPDVRDDVVPVLDVAATLLGGGKSSRLFKQIREKEALVHSVDGWTYNPGEPGLFGVSLLCDGDKFAAAEHRVIEMVEGLKQDDSVLTSEIEKVRKQFRSAQFSKLKTVQGMASELGGSWLIAHDLEFSSRYLEKVSQTTIDDIQHAAERFLGRENSTSYALLPKGSQSEGRRSVRQPEQSSAELFTLSNGLRCLVKEDRRLPFVEFRVVFRGGVLAETVQNSGLSTLLGRLLVKGAGERSAEDIADAIESVGGALEGYSGNNSFGVSMEVMNEDLALGLDLLRAVMCEASLPEEEIAREKEVQLAGIRGQRDKLLNRGYSLFKRTLFGEKGYGLESLGTESSVQALHRKPLRNHQTSLMVPGNCVMAVYGAVDLEQLKPELERWFGDWTGSNGKLPEFATVTPKNEAAKVFEVYDKKQIVVVLGFPGLALGNPDRYALDLIQESCSDLGSRLFMRIREKLGLAYYVGAQNFVGLSPGSFSFYVGSQPGQANRVEEELREETRLLAENGLSDDELSRAKAKLLGHRKIAKQDLGGRALMAALDELYGLGYDHEKTEDEAYASVTLDDVKRVAAKYLVEDRAVVAVVGPTPD